MISLYTEFEISVPKTAQGPNLSTGHVTLITPLWGHSRPQTGTCHD